MTDIERTIAPHVEQEWAEALLLELRLRSVPGERIGDVLAEVESHVVESGQTAREAFGDPVEYARSLELPMLPDSVGLTLVGLLPIFVQLIGMLLVAVTVPWEQGPAAITQLDLAGAGLVAVLLVTVACLADRMLRTIVHGPYLLLAAIVVAAGLVVAAVGYLALSVLDLRAPVLELSRPTLLVAGLVLLLAGTAAHLWLERRDAEKPDLVSSPVPGGEQPARPLPVSLISALAVPVATVLVVGILVVL